MVQNLPNDWHIMVVDMPGHGHTTRKMSDSFSFAAQAARIRQVGTWCTMVACKMSRFVNRITHRVVGISYFCSIVPFSKESHCVDPVCSNEPTQLHTRIIQKCTQWPVKCESLQQ